MEFRWEALQGGALDHQIEGAQPFGRQVEEVSGLVLDPRRFLNAGLSGRS